MHDSYKWSLDFQVNIDNKAYAAYADRCVQRETALVTQ